MTVKKKQKKKHDSENFETSTVCVFVFSQYIYTSMNISNAFEIFATRFKYYKRG